MFHYYSASRRASLLVEPISTNDNSTRWSMLFGVQLHKSNSLSQSRAGNVSEVPYGKSCCASVEPRSRPDAQPGLPPDSYMSPEHQAALPSAPTVARTRQGGWTSGAVLLGVVLGFFLVRPAPARRRPAPDGLPRPVRPSAGCGAPRLPPLPQLDHETRAHVELGRGRPARRPGHHGVHHASHRSTDRTVFALSTIR
jgi:hypothetical protein